MIAEKATVYKKFPTPLINRLEKHFVLMSSILSVQENAILSQLDSWISQFSNVKSRLASLSTDTITMCKFLLVKRKVTNEGSDLLLSIDHYVHLAMHVYWKRQPFFTQQKS